MVTLASNDIPFPLLFEGVEKKLEIKYKIPDYYPTTSGGLRDIDSQEWSYLLNSFGCQILNSINNEFFDAYLLSESSLFVYRDRVVLKTCGTTKLLSCLPLLEQYSRNAFEGDMIIEYALFTRRNYKYPAMQPFPHSSWEEEKEQIKHHFPLGSDFIVGDLSGDHFYVFMQDNRAQDDSIEEYSTFEIAMNDLSRESMSHFYKTENVTGETTLTQSGISELIPEKTEIDCLMFNPFGFSLNGILNSYYYTMHITPQEECSYVSYETNRDVKGYDALKLSHKVVETFNPEKYTIVAIHSKNYKNIFPVDVFEERSIEISHHFVLNFYSGSVGPSRK